MQHLVANVRSARAILDQHLKAKHEPAPHPEGMKTRINKDRHDAQDGLPSQSEFCPLVSILVTSLPRLFSQRERTGITFPSE